MSAAANPSVASLVRFASPACWHSIAFRNNPIAAKPSGPSPTTGFRNKNDRNEDAEDPLPQPPCPGEGPLRKPPCPELSESEETPHEEERHN